jgi:hypothetical protein
MTEQKCFYPSDTPANPALDFASDLRRAAAVPPDIRNHKAFDEMFVKCAEFLESRVAFDTECVVAVWKAVAEEAEARAEAAEAALAEKAENYDTLFELSQSNHRLWHAAEARANVAEAALAECRAALADLVDGMHTDDIRRFSGLSPERCEAIRALAPTEVK